MAAQIEKHECPHCQRHEERIAELEAKIAKLEKNSANSSKPPSSDIAKPSGPQKKSGTKRKRGAQPGHERHQREPFQENEIDLFWDYTFDTCPDCGHDVTPADLPPRVIQQIDLVTAPTVVSEHRSQAFWCEHCQKTHFAPIHEDVRKAGLVLG